MEQLASIDRTPPAFLDLAGHPVRWNLLTQLAQSDRRVDELVEVAGQAQPLVSYHLGRLRDGGLLTSRRSSKDGRATYYHLDLDQFGASLSMTGAALHPGLGVVLPDGSTLRGETRPAPVRVLFACTGNSARSQIAEALLRNLGDGVETVSGGSAPKPIHPLAVEVLARRGIDISDWRSKPLTDFAGQRFDFVVSLCDKVREHCPEFAGGGTAIHWSIEDPSSPEGTVAARRQRFERLALDLEVRVRWLTRMINTNTTNTNTTNTNTNTHGGSNR